LLRLKIVLWVAAVEPAQAWTASERAVSRRSRMGFAGQATWHWLDAGVGLTMWSLAFFCLAGV
jgi:hypothetical protein